MLLPEASPDDQIYLTSAQAGQVAGVSAAAIRRWEKLGYLSSITEPGQMRLYAYEAVVTAEFRAREAAIRTSGSEARVQRHFAA